MTEDSDGEYEYEEVQLPDFTVFLLGHGKACFFYLSRCLLMMMT